MTPPAAFVLDDRAIAHALGQLQARLTDLRPVYADLGLSMVERVRRTFIEQRDPWGQPWQPLGPLTVRLRRTGRGTGGHQILRDTGRLLNSMTYRATRHEVAIGSNVIYGPTHQFGATIFPRRGRFLWAGRPGGPRVPLRRAVIPARPFLPIRQGAVDLPPAWQQEVLAILAHHLGA